MNPTHFNSVMPTFPVADLDRAVKFYVEVLGFARKFQNGATFAIIGRDGVELSLAASSFAAIPAGNGRCYFKLSAGIDALYAELQARGASILHKLRDEPYQMREFLIADPDQNEINFGQPI